MCWLSKKTHDWWKIFSKGHSGYSPLRRGIGSLMLGFCWYGLRHTLTAMSGANVAWRVWIRKAKPYTAKGLSNNQKDNLAMIFVGKHAQVKRKRSSWRGNPPHQKTKLQRSIYLEHKMKQKAVWKRRYSPQAGKGVNHSYSSVKNGRPVSQDQQARGYNGLIKEIQRQCSLVLPSSSLTVTRSIQEGNNYHWKKRV